MKVKTCPKLNKCYKVDMVLDKQFDVPELYPILIRQVCEKCKEGK
jgi:hypothetical protein